MSKNATGYWFWANESGPGWNVRIVLDRATRQWYRVREAAQRTVTPISRTRAVAIWQCAGAKLVPAY